MAVLSRVRRGLPALAILLLAGSPGLASAEAVEARYVAALGGIAIMEIDLLLDLGQGGYRIRTRLRTRGVGTLFGQGEQVTEAEGTFRGIEPAPARYRTEGAWRGTFRQIVLAYPPGTAPPVLQRLEPPEAPGEREAVPPALRLGTLDPLSALVKLSRAVAERGRCDGMAAVFDGRRRSDAWARTAGRDVLPRVRWRGEAWSGEALRCGLEWRQVAGFLQGQAERARTNAGLGWIAPAWPGGPPVPVRAELPLRWLGTLHLYLVQAAPAPERAWDRPGIGAPAP